MHMRAESRTAGHRRWPWAVAAVVLLGGATFAGIGAYRAATAPDVYVPPAAAPMPGGDLSGVQRHINGSPAVPDPTNMRANTIEFPDLRVYAPLLSVSVKQSDIVVPFDAHEVGVYNGAAPLTASAGSTALVGHVTNGAVRGAFYPLAGAERGMTIWTRDGKHVARSWVVRRVVTYPRTGLPDRLFESVGPRRLVLITCGGEVTWVGSARHYADNVVVEAVPAKQQPSNPS